MSAESFGDKENSHFQWHIESGQLIRLVSDFGPRNIVDAVMTLVNQPIDILNAHFACVSQLQRASRLKTTSNNAKRNRRTAAGILYRMDS